MIVDYDGATPLNEVRAALSSGYANGAWNGTGIISIDASSSTNHAIGYAEASDLFGAFPALFAGQEVDDTSVLVRHTLYGDANLDKHVDLFDFNRLAAHFGASSTIWSQGNFNFDNITNLRDFDLLAGNFGRVSEGPPTTLPAGQHTIEFTAEGGIFSQDITYNITVSGRRPPAQADGSIRERGLASASSPFADVGKIEPMSELLEAEAALV